MALILLASALVLGATVVRWLRLPVYPFEAVALIVVVGLFGWTWLAFLAALVAPLAVAVPLTVGVAALASGALWWPRRHHGPEFRALPGGRWGWAWWGAATAVTVVLFGRLTWTHDLPAEADGVYSAGSTWADFGLHAAIVSHLAQFDRMPLDLPVASGATLTYPFLVDLLSALYLRDGASLALALFVPGVLLALAICQLLMSFSLRLFGHVGAAVGGLVLVLSTGSAAGVALAWGDWRASGQSLPGFLANLPRDYTVLSAENGNVTNLVAHALLPQRAFLFGMGVALTVLILLHSARESGSRRHLVAAAVLIGLLPMAHPHSFIATGAVFAAVTVEAAVRSRRVPWLHVGAGAGALALAAPQLVWQQMANGGGGTGGRFRPGWMVHDGESIWHFWWINFGLMGVFFVVLPVLLVVRRDLRRYLVWYLPCLALLALTQLYALQPFEYDNVKLIYYVYLMAGLFAAWLAVLAYRARRWSAALLVPAALAVVTPGLLSLTHEAGLHDQFASTADVALADWVRADTAPGAVFLTTDRPAQPIATLGGRSIVMGYRGWLYNFHLPYEERQAAVSAAMLGHTDDPAVRLYAPDYLAVATNEDPSWTLDRDRLATLPVAYRNPEWTVYDLPH